MKKQWGWKRLEQKFLGQAQSSFTIHPSTWSAFTVGVYLTVVRNFSPCWETHDFFSFWFNNSMYHSSIFFTLTGVMFYPFLKGKLNSPINHFNLDFEVIDLNSFFSLGVTVLINPIYLCISIFFHFCLLSQTTVYISSPPTLKFMTYYHRISNYYNTYSHCYCWVMLLKEIYPFH